MKKEELTRMRELARDYDCILERIERLRSQAERMTAMLDGLPRGSAMRSKIEESVVKLESVVEECGDKLLELSTLEEKFRAEIKDLPTDQRSVLMYRYIDGLDYRIIARTLKRSVSLIFYLHRRGLKNILQRCSELQ